MFAVDNLIVDSRVALNKLSIDREMFSRSCGCLFVLALPFTTQTLNLCMSFDKGGRGGGLMRGIKIPTIKKERLF